MYQVIVRNGRKTMQKQTFKNEDDAWEFYDRFSDHYECEFRNLNVLKGK